MKIKIIETMKKIVGKERRITYKLIKGRGGGVNVGRHMYPEKEQEEIPI